MGRFAQVQQEVRIVWRWCLATACGASSKTSVNMSSSLARTHGRSSTQIRTISCERGAYERADGMVRWYQDGTSVVAAVIGPKQASQAREDAEQAVVEVHVKPRNGIAELKDRARYEQVVKRVVEAVVQSKLHPRTSINIICQVVSDDGALLSCLLNATCAALVDAGVPMTTMFASITCAVLPGDVVVVDPTSKEEQAASAVVCIANPFHFDLRESPSGKPSPCIQEGVLASYTSGSFSTDRYLDVLDLCQKSAVHVAEFTRLFLKQL